MKYEKLYPLWEFPQYCLVINKSADNCVLICNFYYLMFNNIWKIPIILFISLFVYKLMVTNLVMKLVSEVE